MPNNSKQEKNASAKDELHTTFVEDHILKQGSDEKLSYPRKVGNAIVYYRREVSEQPNISDPEWLEENEKIKDLTLKQGSDWKQSYPRKSETSFVHPRRKVSKQPNISDPKWLEECRKIDLEERKLMKPDIIEQLHKLALTDWKRDEEMQKQHSSRKVDSDIPPCFKQSEMPVPKPAFFSISFETCSECLSVFYDESEFDRHMEIFERDGKCEVVTEEPIHGRMECIIFDLGFKDLEPEELVQNMATAGTTCKSFACHICHKQYHRKRDLIVHHYYHFKQNTYFPSDVIDSSLSVSWRKKVGQERKKNILQVYKESKKKMLQVCSHCKSPLKKVICNHYCKDPLDGSYVCAFCKKKYMLKSSVLRHVMRHLKMKEKCFEIYNHVFGPKRGESHDLRELLCEDEARPFVCQICHEGFFEKHLLSHHNKTCHELEESGIAMLSKMDLS